MSLASSNERFEKMKISFHSVFKVDKVCLFAFCLFLSFQSLAQNQTDYFIHKATWEESLRVSCDKLNYDYNHREGKYYYTLMFRKNWDSFNDEVDIIQEQIRYTFQSAEVRRYLDREE